MKLALLILGPMLGYAVGSIGTTLLILRRRDRQHREKMWGANKADRERYERREAEHRRLVARLKEEGRI